MELEMESSARSVDRSKEHSIKKPRIAGADDSDMNMNVNINKDRGFGRYAAAERERSLERAPPPQRGSPMLERMRAIEREREREREGERRVRSVSNIIAEDEREKEREREEASRGSQQELVNQYKTALGELTFNSKPIITNLTIIAGENIHAAKGIAATVCSHILEVPNEQKLPSLYLLDSIVKNIGGDYVKYFVARLPEVFCKAYRQVDPVTHPGMQHLFRTWRGVFPPMPLRIIEEELQFPPSVNGSSSGTTTPRSSETQSQRPGHSIHVNPKYLEARQRLQQSNRAEGVSSENNGDEAIHESDRSERNMNASPKAWAESPLKIPSIQRPPRGNTSSEAAYGQKPSAGYTDYDYSMDPVRSSEMGMRRPNERDTEREDGTGRPWHGERLGELESNSTSVTYSQRNGYDWQKLPARGPLIDAYGNYRGPKSARSPLLHVPNPHDITNKSSRLVPRNWQNSEEEEYMWEDMNARSMDHGRGSEKLRKGDWIPEDIDKPLGLGRGKRIGPEPDLFDGHLRTAGPLSQMDQPMVDEERVPRRELDDRLASPLMQHDLVARSSREVSMESSGLIRTAQNTLVPRSLPGWPQQHINLPPYSRPRVLPMDLPHQSSISSLNVGRSEGLAISSVNGGLSTSIGHSSGPRPSFRTNNGIGTGPPSFGALPPVTPLSSGLSARLRQSPKPHSPSELPSMQAVPGSPTSSLPRQQSVQPVQHQQQNNFIRADHLQVQNQKTHPSQLQHSHPPLPQVQQVLQSQTTSDSTSQLPHSHIQSGLSLQQLQMRQQIQSLQQFQSQSSAILPQQGQSMQFSQQVPTELPLPQIQPVSLSQPLIPTHVVQQPDLRTPLQPPPPSYGPSQTLGYPASGISGNPTSLLQGQTNTQNLLDVIFKSGLLPPNTLQSGCNPPPVSSSGSSGILDIATTQASLHIQPPLPSGPPPVQFSAATTVSLPVPPAVPLPISTPVSSHSGPTPTPALGPPSLGSLPMPPQPLRPVQPPLPPGPPPASSLVGSTSQATSSVSAPLSSIHPVSNLLNSLVAKGFITAPTESASSSLSMSSTSLMPTQLNNYSTAVIATSSLQAPVSVPFASDNPFSTTVDVPPTLVSAVAPLESSGEAQSGKDQIGVEFKRGRILEYHPSVINALYDDFPKQCQTCGLRFLSQEEHCKHMDWHALKNREQKSQRKTSRGWFRRLQEWVGGTVPAESAVAFSFSPQEAGQNSQDSEEPAVPFDENQPICHLCGEVFEEFYSHETDEWMCKGTVYLNAPCGTSIGSSARSLLGPIVHAKCRSESAAVTLVDPEENDVDDDVLGCRRKTVQY